MNQYLGPDFEAYLNGDEMRGHVTLRQAARNYLLCLGIGTNPAFTDRDIIGALRERAGMEPADEWEESFDNPHVTDIFQGHLVAVLAAAGVPPLEEPVTAVRVAQAFEQLSETL